ncbi:MAG: hypothetical protein KME05_08245 [Gloeocapsa sp. UFS-A4-WI-NPMV-4B04]|nr:hypothetical protein [Gloeocapsa sp. UFS-A4-WI-NPMV-4B04]
MNLVWTDASPVVEGVKTFSKGLLTGGAAVALMSVRHLAVFVSVRMTAEPTFHRKFRGLGLLLLYQDHTPLTHNRAFR